MGAKGRQRTGCRQQRGLVHCTCLQCVPEGQPLLRVLNVSDNVLAEDWLPASSATWLHTLIAIGPITSSVPLSAGTPGLRELSFTAVTSTAGHHFRSFCSAPMYKCQSKTKASVYKLENTSGQARNTTTKLACSTYITRHY